MTMTIRQIKDTVNYGKTYNTEWAQMSCVYIAGLYNFVDAWYRFSGHMTRTFLVGALRASDTDMIYAAYSDDALANLIWRLQMAVSENHPEGVPNAL